MIICLTTDKRHLTLLLLGTSRNAYISSNLLGRGQFFFRHRVNPGGIHNINPSFLPLWAYSLHLSLSVTSLSPALYPCVLRNVINLVLTYYSTGPSSCSLISLSDTLSCLMRRWGKKSEITQTKKSCVLKIPKLNQVFRWWPNSWNFYRKGILHSLSLGARNDLTLLFIRFEISNKFC